VSVEVKIQGREDDLTVLSTRIHKVLPPFSPYVFKS
jgi:hypothetical protein